ncbi:MAG: hypothetical protein NTV05_17115 [Acidobacteria bacterium]|nr:hypothetical protein [Acidobacteriota bacterium]
MTELGCQQMIIALEAAQELFRDAERRLEALVRPIRETFGITDEAIAAESIRMVSEESGLNG